MLTAGEVGLGQEVERTRLKAGSCFLRAEAPRICSGVAKCCPLRCDTHPRGQQECPGSPPGEEKLALRASNPNLCRSEGHAKQGWNLTLGNQH